MSTRFWGHLSVLSASWCLACGGSVSQLPPPEYQKPELPPWQAPEPEPDPLDAIEMDGEWVTEEETSPSADTAPDDGESGQAEGGTPEDAPALDGEPAKDERSLEAAPAAKDEPVQTPQAEAEPAHDSELPESAGNSQLEGRERGRDPSAIETAPAP